MSLITYKFIAAFLLFMTTVLTALYPLKRHSSLKQGESFELMEALASGIFLGAAFFHLLPDAISELNGVLLTFHYPIAEVICVASFLILLILERLTLAHPAINTKHAIPYLLLCILTIHAVIEGAALGLNHGLSETVILFIAIAAHKGSESFALCVSFLKHEISYQRTRFYIVLFACVTPLGIALGTFINTEMIAGHADGLAGILSACAAGTFLYISTLHHMHFHQHRGEAQGMAEYAGLVLGVAMMAVLALWT